MANNIEEPRPRRKLLSLGGQKRSVEEREHKPKTPKFVRNRDCVYMVWSPQGEMPKRVYTHEERDVALKHCIQLAARTGHRFYVMRAWRGFDPADESEA